MKYTAYIVASLVLVQAAFSARAAEPPTFEQVAKKIEAKFEPADAKPGQTVTLKVTVQLLDGWHTYPLFQPDKGARTYVNKFMFPESGPLVFVGEINDPPGFKEKSEPLANIEKMHVYLGGASWECKAVVLPSTKAGAVSSKIKFRVLVCDKDNCMTKVVELDAGLKVAGDPVAVDPKYQKEIDKPKK